MTQDNQNDQSPEEKASDADEPILHLTEPADDIQEADDEDLDPLAATAELEEGLDDDFHEEEDDFVDSLGMEIGTEEEEDGTAMDLPEGLDIAPEQLDAALERVIQKMFYDKIDRVLVSVIEKRVKREINRIKTALLDEVDDDT